MIFNGIYQITEVEEIKVTREDLLWGLCESIRRGLGQGEAFTENYPEYVMKKNSYNSEESKCHGLVEPRDRWRSFFWNFRISEDSSSSDNWITFSSNQVRGVPFDSNVSKPSMHFILQYTDIYAKKETSHMLTISMRDNDNKMYGWSGNIYDLAKSIMEVLRERGYYEKVVDTCIKVGIL